VEDAAEGVVNLMEALRKELDSIGAKKKARGVAPAATRRSGEGLIIWN